jgi:hypothetical protein
MRPATNFFPVVLGLLALLPAAAVAAGPALDPAKTDVCARVPGAAVAAAVGGTLKSARPFADPDGGFARCTYLVATGKNGAESAAFVLWLYRDSDYDAMVSAVEGPTEKVEGVGDAAILFREEDGRAKLLFVRRGRYSAEATAADADGARKLAKVALEKL